jgi:hypothetical protein
MGPSFVLAACLHLFAQPPSGSERSGSAEAIPTRASLASNFGLLPISFEENRGQADARVRYLSRGNGYSLFLTDKEAVLALRQPDPTKAKSGAPQATRAGQQRARTDKAFRTDVIRMELAGANHALQVQGADKLPGTANYFIGNDPAKWHSGVQTYGKVRYESVYPGVDLVYYGNQGQLEYDFVVAPNADPKPIRLRFAGAKTLKLDSHGDLEVIAKNGQVAFHKPVVYQQTAGERKLIHGGFTVLSKNTVSFKLGTYDHSNSVVIDPTLVYSTYLGGSNGDDYGTSITVDSGGNAYVAGAVYATDFPATAGAYQASQKAASANLFNAFVAKLNSTGTTLLYATYLGGSGNTAKAGTLNHGDYPESVAVNASGEAFVTGTAYSADFPVTAGAFQTTNRAAANGVPNGFVTKLNATGTSLVYSTYLGGSGVSGHAGSGGIGSGSGTYGDGCSHIAIDANGDAYVTGVAYSTDFPTTSGAFQSVNKSASLYHPNAFVTKLAANGVSLIYSTYLGGSTGDGASGLAVDSTGNAYIGGATYSSDFPVTNGAFQSSNHAFGTGNSNGFLTKVNPSGSALVYSTYLGGSGNGNGPSGNDNGDSASSVAVDASGDLYAFGLTASSDFPTTNNAFQTVNMAYQSNAGPSFFVTKLNPAGTSLSYSTFVGGSQANLLPGSNGLAINSAGEAFITGYVLGNDFPVTSTALQSSPPCVLATNGTITDYSNPVLTELTATAPPWSTPVTSGAAAMSASLPDRQPPHFATCPTDSRWAQAVTYT